MHSSSRQKKQLKSYEQRQRRRLSAPAPKQAQYLDWTTSSLLILGRSKTDQVAALRARIRPDLTPDSSASSKPLVTQPTIQGLEVPASPKPKVKSFKGPTYPNSQRPRGLTVATRPKPTPIDLPLLGERAEIGTLIEFEPDQVDDLIRRLNVLRKNCARYKYEKNARNKADARKNSLPSIKPEHLQSGRRIEVILLDRTAGLLFAFDELCQALLFCANDKMFRSVSRECGEWLVKVGTSLEQKK